MAVKAFDWLRYHRHRTPDKLAMVDLNSQRRFTYAEFDSRAARLATGLKEKLGVQRGDRVAILSHNSTDVYELQFALGKLGAVFVPLNWRLAVPELQYIIDDCTPRVLIYDRVLQDAVTELQGLCNLTHVVDVSGDGGDSGYETLISEALHEAEPVEISHDDLQTVMYTSGTTGHPKGAMITHGMTFWNVINLGPLAEISGRSVQLQVLPTFHTAGLNCYANVIFHHGGTVVLMREFIPSHALAHLTDPELGITHFFGVPAIYLFIMQLPEFATADLGNLQLCGVGGAPCAIPILETWNAKGVPFSQGYGMTETSPSVMALDPKDGIRKVGSAGLPVLHNDVKIVDEGGNDIIEPNLVGELWVKGPNITPGYWNNEKATRESLTDGWLHTGDAARRDEEGYYYIVDRWKDMYISGGENVYPAEVEDVLYKIEGIAEVAVIGIPDEKWGESGQAVVVLKEGVSLSEEDIIGYCSGKLARYKIPKSVRFMEALPRNATGKVLKRDLRS